MKEVHEKYIRDCFHLAKQSLGKTSPNPLVGSVIVKDGEVISNGFHRKSGEAHAEIDAIQNANTDVSGSTLYCNLEPCCHYNKKTPPCAQEIVKSGIKKVVISNLDPNPKVAGRGIKLLKEAGIEVVTDILTDEGKILNEVFFHHIKTRRPFIHLKWAQTLDGKSATINNHSQWITNEASREYAHRERSLYDGVLVGSGTAKMDNPSLTIRIPGKPIECRRRIVLSHGEELPKDLKIFTDEFKDKTLIVTDKNQAIPTGIATMEPTVVKDEFNLVELMERLYLDGTKSLYVEGGMQTLSHFINAGLFDRVSVFIAPKLLGAGLSLSSGAISFMHDAINFEDGVWTPIENNMLFESRRNVCLQD